MELEHCLGVFLLRDGSGGYQSCKAMEFGVVPWPLDLGLIDLG